MSEKKTAVIALGGNAITQENQEGDIYEQFANTRQSLDGVLELLEMGHRVIITHGNGPQVGNEMIRSEESARLVPMLESRLPRRTVYFDWQRCASPLFRRGGYPNRSP